jgi:hypothetical protein
VGVSPITLAFLPPRSHGSEAAGRSGHAVKCGRIRLAVSCSPQPQPHFIRGPGGRPRLTFKLLPRRSPLWDPAGRLGHIVKCAHIAPSKLGTAFHPRSSWAANEIEGGVLLKLPHTNLTPALATSLRHTITAERQIRAVVPAQSQRPRRSTDRPACQQRQPYRQRHRTARAWTRNSSTIPF